MEPHRFKLGDKVTIHSGQDRGRVGHIVGITSQDSGSAIIEVRVDPESLRSRESGPS